VFDYIVKYKYATKIPYPHHLQNEQPTYTV
jgi:hypothetical protein